MQNMLINMTNNMSSPVSMPDMQLHIRHIGHIGHMYGPPTSLMKEILLAQRTTPCILTADSEAWAARGG